MRSRLQEIRTAAGREDGFTVFEMLVASMILLMGMMATLTAFDSATRNTLRLKESQVLLDRAQQELESIRALPYNQIALSALPAHSQDPDSPHSRVSGGRFSLSKNPTTPRFAELVYNGSSLYGGGTVSGGTVAPQSSVITTGDLQMVVYRYVVWQRDANCPNTAPAGQPSCPGNQDFKRVIVAVRLTSGGSNFSDRPYVEVQSDFIDPTESALTDPVAGPDGVVSAQQFWLSDTPCASAGDTVRSEVNADHLLHNTLGTCSSGPKTGGTTPGAPDALLTSAPPDPFLDDPSLPGVFDYSNDFALEPSPPDGDRGVQIRRQDASGCTYNSASLGADPQTKIHRWVSDPLPATFTATGHATLEFYTAAINNALHTGRLCIYIFRRNGSQDTMVTNPATGLPYFTYPPSAGESWPRATPTASDPLGWKKIRFDMDFTQFDISEGHRLGVALSTERSGTTYDAGLQVLYDHHLTPSRIEVETTTPLDLADIPSLTISNPTVTSLPTTLTGELRRFAAGQNVTYRLDDPTNGPILTATTTPTPTPSSGPAAVSVTLPSTLSNGTHTLYAIGDLGDLTGRQFTVNILRVNSSALVKSTGCRGGYIKRNGSYYVYADVGGTPSSVTANVSSITAGQTAVPLTAGNYTVNGEIYNYRSAALTSGSTLAAGSASYTITPAGGVATAGSAVIDIAAPTPVDVQTVNATGGTVGLPQPADSVVFTYSEPIEPCSLVAGWDGLDPVDIVTYMADAGGSNDTLYFYNPATGTQVPLGSVNLGTSKGDYTGSSNAIFGIGATPGTIAVNSYQVTVTLGSLYSGSVKTGATADVMRWTGGATPAPPTDYAGNNGTTTAVNESGISDKEF